ncbi:hypothetical protein KIPB_008171 [Kipferlia bialata]|uniref:Uncharacterized protein n=1 Tax=Kipferlia bialata TaxID=797122 RepID=A0A9K3D1Z2_9EUKA|nr:hypothetical protein KIPB_008171 [Kipferlia bialata]|eukprot:g8171.t1
MYFANTPGTHYRFKSPDARQTLDIRDCPGAPLAFYSGLFSHQYQTPGCGLVPLLAMAVPALQAKCQHIENNLYGADTKVFVDMARGMLFGARSALATLKAEHCTNTVATFVSCLNRCDYALCERVLSPSGIAVRHVFAKESERVSLYKQRDPYVRDHVKELAVALTRTALSDTTPDADITTWGGESRVKWSYDSRACTLHLHHFQMAEPHPSLRQHSGDGITLSLVDCGVAYLTRENKDTLRSVFLPPANCPVPTLDGSTLVLYRHVPDSEEGAVQIVTAHTIRINSQENVPFEAVATPLDPSFGEWRYLLRTGQIMMAESDDADSRVAVPAPTRWRVSVPMSPVVALFSAIYTWAMVAGAKERVTEARNVGLPAFTLRAICAVTRQSPFVSDVLHAAKTPSQTETKAEVVPEVVPEPTPEVEAAPAPEVEAVEPVVTATPEPEPVEEVAEVEVEAEEVEVTEPAVVETAEPKAEAETEAEAEAFVAEEVAEEVEEVAEPVPEVEEEAVEAVTEEAEVVEEKVEETVEAEVAEAEVAEEEETPEPETEVQEAVEEVVTPEEEREPEVVTEAEPVAEEEEVAEAEETPEEVEAETEAVEETPEPVAEAEE